ncbi:hypothetical protein GF360_00525 [candidate division WWE3 bacterium]|nr:hypothetical protein [candidate division WWE3 bacterium]
MPTNLNKTLAARIVLGFLGGLLIGLVVFGVSRRINPSSTVQIKINEKSYTLEIAKTPAQRAKGLMLRENLDENKGMLFVFPREGRHGFWMYKTRIPLKMIWLDKNWKVVHMEAQVPPCESEDPLKCPSYYPSKPAMYVIEINP